MAWAAGWIGLGRVSQPLAASFAHKYLNTFLNYSGSLCLPILLLWPCRILSARIGHIAHGNVLDVCPSHISLDYGLCLRLTFDSINFWLSHSTSSSSAAQCTDKTLWPKIYYCKLGLQTIEVDRCGFRGFLLHFHSNWMANVVAVTRQTIRSIDTESQCISFRVMFPILFFSPVFLLNHSRSEWENLNSPLIWQLFSLHSQAV